MTVKSPAFISLQALAGALRAAGLDDDAARLGASLTDGARRLEQAEAALVSLDQASGWLRAILAELGAVADAVHATLGVRWRSVAGREYGEVADGLHRTAAGLVAEAEQWLALCAAARREAEEQAQAARRDVELAEAAARMVLQAAAA